MKIRNGFVSNSSSSSFVIQVNGAATKCPTCGRTPNSIVDVLGGMSGSGWCRDSESSLESLDDYLSELEYELNSEKSSLEKLLQRDPEELTYPQWDKATKVKKSIEWTEEAIVEFEERIAKFKQAEAEGNKVYRLSLSHHDELASHILNENVEAGIITVLEGEDY